MPAIDSSFVILPRFTTLVGATTFTTLPMDVSAYGGAQFHIWRGPFRVASQTPPSAFTVYLEESLDTETWVLGPSTPTQYVIGESDPKFFSYDFRLRWFRLKVVVAGDSPIVTCWAEGLLRGGGGGLWPGLGLDAGPSGAVAAGLRTPAGIPALGAYWKGFKGPYANVPVDSTEQEQRDRAQMLMERGLTHEQVYGW